MRIIFNRYMLITIISIFVVNRVLLELGAPFWLPLLITMVYCYFMGKQVGFAVYHDMAAEKLGDVFGGFDPDTGKIYGKDGTEL